MSPLQNTLVDTAPALNILNRMLVVAAREVWNYCLGRSVDESGAHLKIYHFDTSLLVKVVHT